MSRGKVEEPLLAAHPKLFKFLTDDGHAPFQYGFVWPLPTEDGPGEWVDIGDDGPLVACRNGLHFFDAENDRWMRDGGMVYEVETDGEVIFDHDKWVARRARLTRLVGKVPEYNVNWPIVRKFWDRYDRFKPLHDRWLKKQIPASLRKHFGDGDLIDGYYRYFQVLKAKIAYERAAYTLNRVLGKGDSEAAKARRRSLRRQSEQMNQVGHMSRFHPTDVASLAKYLGLRRPSDARVKHIDDVRQARLARWVARRATGPTYQDFVQHLKELSA